MERKMRYTLMGVACLWIFSCNSNPEKTTGEIMKSIDSTTKSTDSTITSIDKENETWQYEDDTDAMTSKINHFAAIESTTELSLSEPYDGYNKAHLTIRKKRGGSDVEIQIDKGQFIFGVYDTEIKARFDNRHYITYTALKSSDDDPRIMFIQDESFIRNIANSKQTNNRSYHLSGW